MTKIYDFCLESLEERYSSQWNEMFPREFKKAGLEYVRVDGDTLTSRIETGSFLDVSSTNYYKASQIKKISRLFYEYKIRDGDIFFVHDMWFPIEMLKYMITLNKVKVKIYCYLHAGSYTKEDFIECLSDWAKYQEVAWARAVDGIFVGSEYHKQSFIERRVKKYATEKDAENIIKKIHVTGAPFCTQDAINMINNRTTRILTKKKRIIFPNRFDYEKRPNMFLSATMILKREFPDWEFVVTSSSSEFKSNREWLIQQALVLEEQGYIKIRINLSKKEYYTMLAESMFMLSTTIEENFGYCTLEAMTFNTIPIVPNKYSHPELLKGLTQYMYDDYDDMIDMLREYMTKCETNINLCRLAEFYDNSIEKMCNVMWNEREL